MGRPSTICCCGGAPLPPWPQAAAEAREAHKAHKDWDKEERREKRVCSVSICISFISHPTMYALGLKPSASLDQVGSWRDFMSGQKAKKKKGSLTARPPHLCQRPCCPQQAPGANFDLGQPLIQGEFMPPKPKMEPSKAPEKFGGPKDEKRIERPDEVSKAW